MQYQVLVLDSASDPHVGNADFEAEGLRDCAEVRFLRIREETELEPFLAGADALIVWHQVCLTSWTMGRLRRAKVIVRNGVGFESVDTAAAFSVGIAVCNVPDYGTEEVADHAMALCLALNRQLPLLIKDIARGNWNYEAGRACRRSREMVFGVVGCGRIGTAAALRAKAFGFEVCFYDPYVPSGYEKAIGVRRVHTLNALLRTADVLSLHVPLTPETRHLVDEAQLRMMKPSSFIVNTARGAVIRFAAIERALREGWIAGAGLDVLEHEPAGADLSVRFPNCIVTPHSAFYSQESIVEMRRSAAATVREVLINGIYRNVVNAPGASAGRSCEDGSGALPSAAR